MLSFASRFCAPILSALSISIAAGCSVHPLPDDLSQQTTQAIVLNVRCEAKFALAERVAHLLRDSGDPALAGINPEEVVKRIEEIHARNKKIAITIERYLASAIAYNFDFMIDEFNNNVVDMGLFQLPLPEAYL